jgi:hypothetical protein
MEMTPREQTQLLAHKFQTNAIQKRYQSLVELINSMYKTTLVMKEKW